MSVNAWVSPRLVGRTPHWAAVGRRVRSGLVGLVIVAVMALPLPAARLTAEPSRVPALAAPMVGPAEPAVHGGAQPGGLPLVRARAMMSAKPISAPRSGAGGAGHPAEGAGLPPVLLASADDGRPRALLRAEDEPTTLERLLDTPRPARDPIALASRLAGAPIPWQSTAPFAGPLQAGRRDTFFVLDQGDNSYKARQAVLALVSEQAYWYVQEDQSVREDDLAATAERFDREIVPTVRRVFGSEWSPGIDGDPRVTIFLGSAPGVSAYFSSWDEYPRSVYRYSNEREMIHVNLGSARPGSASFDGTLAHELQHMVHWHLSPLTDTWLDEGLAELASSLAVPSRSPGTSGFQREPDVQLTAWPGSQTSVHYQASYLFARYFAQRFGEAAIAGLLAEGGRPPDSITAYLSRSGRGLTFEDVFEDWIVANLVDDPAVEDGRFSHDGIEHRATLSRGLQPDGQPLDESVAQFGAEYIELTGDGRDAELSFEGAPTVPIVGATPTSGRSLWWSNRADGLDSTLTRRFDLSGVSRATLRFNLWFETEEHFDFLYLLTSRDGGASWQPLRGAAARDDNPTGNALGPGYSGTSGASDRSTRAGAAGPGWIAETADLTPFAGGELLVRFEYVTDQGTHLRGALLDDIEVPEIGFRDDAEADAGWAAEGFLRSDNTIPQTWSLQLVESRRGGESRVRALRADTNGRLTERLPGLGGEVERAVLVVSGLAPRTLESAPFRVSLRPAP